MCITVVNVIARYSCTAQEFSIRKAIEPPAPIAYLQTGEGTPVRRHFEIGCAFQLLKNTSAAFRHTGVCKALDGYFQSEESSGKTRLPRHQMRHTGGVSVAMALWSGHSRTVKICTGVCIPMTDSDLSDRSIEP